MIVEIMPLDVAISSITSCRSVCDFEPSINERFPTTFLNSVPANTFAIW